MAEEDLIYGKNRHFFGGIEPSNMIAFSGEFVGASVNITATLPNDTVIDGQTLCTVSGAVIRRKDNDYPKDEFDGDLVATITSSTTFSDSGVIQNGTYYYAAFPFTAQGVYNRNKANRFVVNEPAAMTEFTATSIYESDTQTAKVEIKATLPDGVAGAVIRKSSVSYPLDENDGEEFQNISTSGTYYDESVSVGNTYYYSAFPYTSTGAYNRSEENRVSVTITAEPPKPAYTYLYGFDITLTTENPSARVTYPEDVDNHGFTPAGLTGANVFKSGSWDLNAGSKFMPRPCIVRSDGTIYKYLKPSNYTQAVDGSNSNVTNSDYGNAMMEWPKIYTKRWVSAGVYHFRCSDAKIDDSYECWCNYDKNNNEIDHFYTSIYEASYSSSKLCSRSGANVSVNIDYSAELNYAKAIGDGWYTFMAADYFLITDLLVMISKSTDTQMSFGNGISNRSATQPTGVTDLKGLFYGINNIEDQHMKAFGMENLWGNTWTRLSGWSYHGTENKLKLTIGTHDGSSVIGFNATANGYVTKNGVNRIDEDYITQMEVFDFGRIPIGVKGTSSIYECDTCDYVNAGTVNQCLIGGCITSSYRNGAFTVELGMPSMSTSMLCGTRLSFKPTLA